MNCMVKKEKICSIVILLFCIFLLYLLLKPEFIKEQIDKNDFTIKVNGKNYNIIVGKPEKKVTRYPLLIYHHGGGYLSLEPFELRKLAQIFAEEGFLFWAPERTPWAPERALETLKEGQIMSKAILDLAIKHPEVNKSNINVVGFCLGSWVAFENDAKSPDVRTVSLLGFGAPYDDTVLYDYVVDLVNETDYSKIFSKILIMLSREDYRVDIGIAETVRKKMINANKTINVITYQKGDHLSLAGNKTYLIDLINYLKGEKNYNVILITFDALGANYLSIYGFDKETAPNLKEFSKQSFIFSNAISQCGTTAQSLVSMFTSRYPYTDDLVTEELVAKKNKLFLPYFLQNRGYNTYGIVRDMLAGSAFGFSHGFDYFDEKLTWPPDAKETFNSAINLTKNNLKEPFFLWIHNEEPHAPYIPPEKYFRIFYKNYSVPTIYSIEGLYNPIDQNYDEFFTEEYDKYRLRLAELSGNVKEYKMYDNKKRKLSEEEVKQLKAQYLGNIMYADENFGKFLKYIKTQPFFNNTIIIISADHGESLGSHNIFDHNYLYQDIIHIPLLIHLPEQDFTRIIEEPVESVDIYPTIAHILGLNVEYNLRGENLFSKNRNKSFQFSEYPDTKILINKEIKFLTERDDLYFYNLSQDYNELNGIDMSHEEKENIFNISILPEDIFLPQNMTEISEEMKQQLIGSGYW